MNNNTGTFIGALKEDRLIGAYTFMLEGMESSREVAFQVKDGQLIEGYGEMNKDGTSFKNYGSINFSSTMPLTRGECDP